MYRLQVSHAGTARVLYSEAPRHEPRIGENESWYSLEAEEEREALVEALELLRERHWKIGLWRYFIAGQLFSNGDQRDVALTVHEADQQFFASVDEAMAAARPRTQIFSRFR